MYDNLRYLYRHDGGFCVRDIDDPISKSEEAFDNSLHMSNGTTSR